MTGSRTVLTWVGHSLVHQIHAGATQSQGVDGIVGPRVHIRHHDLGGHWGPGQRACRRRGGGAQTLPGYLGSNRTSLSFLLRYVSLGNRSHLSVLVSPPVKTCPPLRDFNTSPRPCLSVTQSRAEAAGDSSRGNSAPCSPFKTADPATSPPQISSFSDPENYVLPHAELWREG